MAGEGKRRIIELPEASTLSGNNRFAIDSATQGTKNVTASTVQSFVNAPVIASLSDEAARAKSEEERLEALFTTPTQEAVNNWLDAHPEATTTVQDGSVTVEKLSNDVQADFRALLTNPLSLSYGNTKYFDMSTIQGPDYVSTTDYAGLQSFAFNSINNHLLLGFRGGASITSNGLLVEADKDFNVIQRKQIDLEHCNDITFNPKTNKYYVASGSENKVVYVINPSTLELDNTITLSGLEYGLAQLSYKETDDVYIGTEYSTNKTYLLDSNFQIVKKLFTQTKDANINAMYANVISTDFQGSCILGDLFISLYWIYASAPFSYARCLFYNLENNSLVASIDMPLTIHDEPEGVVFYDGKFTVVGYTREYFTTMNVYINKLVYDESEWADISDAFSVGVTHASESINAKYNRRTKEVVLNCTLGGAAFSNGWNDVLNITKTPYQPTDYYVVANGVIGETICPTIINGRTKIRMRIAASGTTTIFITARYFANGIFV